MSAVLPPNYVAVCGCAAKVEVEGGMNVVTISPCRNGLPQDNASCPNFLAVLDKAVEMDQFIQANGLR